MDIEPNDNGRAPSSKWRLSVILEETPDFVGLADQAGNLLFINAAGRKMVGLERISALYSMKILDCHPEWARRIIRQEGFPTATQNGFWSGETAALRSDGLEIPVSQVIIAHRNSNGQVEYFSTILRDITDRKRAEMIQVRLRRQAALRAVVSGELAVRGVPIRQILHRCSDAIISRLDAAFARVWLLDPEERKLETVASAWTPLEVEPQPGRGQANEQSIGFAATRLAETLRPYSTNDALNDPWIENKDWLRTERITAFAAFPMMAADKFVGVLAVFARQSLEDDTLGELASIADMLARGVERRKEDEEIARSLASERDARLAAEEASRLKDDFLAVISHELRAPLTSILGWTRMLRSGSLDEPSVARALCTIERNVTTQVHLIGDLLDASRIATGKLQLEIRPVDLMSVIESVVDTVRPMVEEKRLKLQLTLEPWVGPFNGDQERMKQIVWNLLNNSIKFTPSGGSIEVRLERLEDKALIIVSDTGQGISPEFLPHMFDQFSQAEVSSTRNSGGLGLGLTIVKRLVELHGGAIYPYSRGDGQGSDFMITLPLATAQEDGHRAVHRYLQSGARADGEPAQALGGVRVLVVDDEYDTREVLGAMLRRYGAEVRAVESAAEAIRMMAEWRPDALISDIAMPNEDGYELIGKVRAMPAESGGAIPAIALTAYAGAQDRQRALVKGYQTHLAKPIEPVELARVIARAVGRNEQAIV